MAKNAPTLEPEELTFEGEKISALVKLRGTVDTAPETEMHRKTTYAFVGEARVDSVAFQDVAKSPRRVHATTIERAVIVEPQMVRDLLDQHKEQTTGQMKLLSLEGESHRAAMVVLEERRRAVKGKGKPAAHDKLELGQLGDLAHDYLVAAAAIDPEKFPDIAAYCDAVEAEVAKGGSMVLAMVEYVRRIKGRYVEAKAAEEEAERRRIAERAEDAAAVHSDPDFD